ncbi:MAG TPA: acyltransferase [Syntrophobacteraceae bacterium]|nr:acyltransferase [Syntrophobacteraceae bacterium]
MNPRFQWFDSLKGLAVIWIVVFHCLLAYGGNLPQPISFGCFSGFVHQCGQGVTFGEFWCAIEGIIVAIIQRGAQGVGVFILASGFGLTYSLVIRGGVRDSWSIWYGRRLRRLLPVYWLAHLVFLVSPFAVLHDPVDYRFLLSFLGDRVYPVDKMFFYFVPAWWFLGLLIELYIVFPLLYELMQRLGPVKYLGLCILSSSAARYIMGSVLQANGYYEMGAFFVCRLWEFGAGMALGKLAAESPDVTLGRLLCWKGFFSGLIIYILGVLAYQPNCLSIFSDGLTAMGLSVMLIQAAYRLNMAPCLGKTFVRAGAYSYGIYMFHQPYVIYAGEKLRPYSPAVFLVFAFGVTILVVLVSMCLEYAANRAANLFKKS